MGEIVKVHFHGEELQAVREGDRVFVVVKRVCEALGVHHTGQWNKLKTASWARVEIISTHDSSGREQAVFCLDLECVPKWLSEINDKKVKPELREKLAVFQRECRDVLARHFGLSQSTAVVVHQPVAADAIASSVAAMGRALGDLQAVVVSIAERMANVEQHVACGGAISPAEHRALMASIGDLAEREMLARNKGHKNCNAARRDIQNAIGEACSWGGKAQPWYALPRDRLFAARQVIARRNADVLKLIHGLERQMTLSLPSASNGVVRP